ncbi:tyrosine-protein kinase [uncultured Parabacteroides sp.]|jgi:capsular exopolysaccharide synthesis family protein|uniref:GumC family protein n=1 Tax=uncultured Parabacteroides sp. TaxID=512312 RepID=UPI0025D7B110|nr:tyrosine-protein kinase [uncultured Parabacteroides sp.]
MKEQTPYTSSFNLVDEFNLRTILDVLLTKWHWFAISVFLCVGGAWVYTKTVPVVYKREAIVQLKNKVKSEEAFNEKQMFDDSNNNIDGEALVFKSRLLMGEVIRRLGLDIGYSTDDGLKVMDIYTDIPLEISFPDSTFIKPASFSVIPLTNDRFRIKGLEDDPNGVMEYTFGTSIDTPIGRMVVSRTSFFNDEWLDTPILITCYDYESLISSLLGELDVKRSVKDANLLTLTYLDTDIKRADDILNMLIQVYVDESMKDKNQIIQATAVFIDERLKLINEELGNVESNIEDYRKQNRSADFNIEAKISLENRSRYDREVTDLLNQIELIELVQQYLHDPLKNESLLPANTGILSKGVEELINNYNATLLEREKLKENGGENSPAVKSRSNGIASLRQVISQSLKNAKGELNMKLEYVSRMLSLEASRISNIPTQQRYVLSVERQQRIKEELFLYLLNKREENALTSATSESNLFVVDPAYGKGTDGANPLVVLLGALLAGLLIPGLFFYLQPMLDVTVRGRKDLEDSLSIPFLGEIPHNRKKEELVVAKLQRDGVSEAFRIVRTNLDFMLDKQKQSHVLMFTSSNPTSGKSFTSSNLAASLVLTGKRTILLEIDLRKGSKKDKDGNVLPGMTHFLSGKITDLSQLIRPYNDLEELDVITSGPIPPNPAELLLGEALDDLIGQLRERYDYIIIDTVPYGMVADPQIISRVADLCIYVIREGLMDRRRLPDVENVYTEGKLPHMSVLLNDACYKHAGYGYGYGYYGYGYGKSYYGYQ